jgi:hypothetical protein
MTTSPRPSFTTRTSLEKITPPKDLPAETKRIVFDHLYGQIATFRNTAELYADLEDRVPDLEGGLKPNEAGLNNFEQKETGGWRKEYSDALDKWAQAFTKKVWAVCCEKDEGGIAVELPQLRRS